jgi:hypothetical protein
MLDCALMVKKDKKNWEEPTEDKIRENGRHIKRKSKGFFAIHYMLVCDPTI